MKHDAPPAPCETQTTVTPATVLAKTDDVLARDICGECLLIPVKGRLADMEKLFALDQVARYVWAHIDGASTVESIAEGAVSCFDVKADQATSDLLEFAQELVRERLVVPVIPGALRSTTADRGEEGNATREDT